jgi:hypothetical protein
MGGMTIKQWMQRGKMIDFTVTFAICVFCYWVLNLLWYQLFGGSKIHWFEAVFWGLAVSALGTYDGRPWRKGSVEKS